MNQLKWNGAEEREIESWGLVGLVELTCCGLWAAEQQGREPREKTSKPIKQIKSFNQLVNVLSSLQLISFMKAKSGRGASSRTEKKVIFFGVKWCAARGLGPSHNQQQTTNEAPSNQQTSWIKIHSIWLIRLASFVGFCWRKVMFGFAGRGFHSQMNPWIVHSHSQIISSIVHSKVNNKKILEQ